MSHLDCVSLEGARIGVDLGGCEAWSGATHRSGPASAFPPGGTSTQTGGGKLTMRASDREARKAIWEAEAALLRRRADSHPMGPPRCRRGPRCGGGSRLVRCGRRRRRLWPCRTPHRSSSPRRSSAPRRRGREIRPPLPFTTRDGHRSPARFVSGLIRPFVQSPALSYPPAETGPATRSKPRRCRRYRNSVFAIPLHVIRMLRMETLFCVVHDWRVVGDGPARRARHPAVPNCLRGAA